MDRADVVQLVLEAFESVVRVDIETLVACAHPQVRVRLLGDPALLPFAGEYAGHDGLRTAAHRFFECFEPIDFKLGDMVVEGNQVVFHWRRTVRARATGRVGALRWVHLMTIEDDQVRQVDGYFDTALAATLLGTAEIDHRGIAEPAKALPAA